MKSFKVAIDGFSGTGKSSTAREVAKRLDFTYIDSGAMYRAVTLYMLRNKIDVQDINEVQKNLPDIHIVFKIDNTSKQQSIFLNGENIENEIRENKVTQKVSNIAKIAAVRDLMVAQQRSFADQNGIVMDGRDIGTVVFPDADVKIFMTADMEERAKRRHKELLEKGINSELNEILSNLKERDKIDSEREESPLFKADDAVEINTTHLTFDEQVKKIVRLVEDKKNES